MATSARFGRTRQGQGSIITVTFDSKRLLFLTDQVTGAFRNGKFQAAVSAANEQLADRVARGMVARLEERIDSRVGGNAAMGGRRPQRGTNHLEQSLMSEKNRFVSASQVKVGLPQWLNKSPAKRYWRRIEQGAPEMVIETTILFKTTGGKFVWPSGGQLDPKLIRRPKGAEPMAKGQFRHSIGPFPAYHYAEGGQEAFARTSMVELYRVQLAKVGIPLESVLRGK